MEAITEPGLSSLIITLSASEDLERSAFASLGRHPGLELGEPQGRMIPAVLSSADPYGDFRTIEAIPGVDLVEVVFVEMPASAALSS